jgi:anthraniloyl-CoA monooxygenase
MRINILGGGPAGLYFAILMKRVDPRHEVHVFERNPPDATFGWGVVFSEETLGALRDADLESYLEITETFASWDTIEMHYRGRTIRSRGHKFSAISRKVLLAILQRRARAFGVELRFEVEIDDPASLADADLVVGADGVNSTVRPWREDAFRPTIVAYPSRFVWFGTNLVFDAFTFNFRETEYGMFQAHAYPFDATTSTFIVECNEETWRRAGLDSISEEENIAFCEELFAEQLRGHRLLSNRSVWLRFLSVKNQSWHDGNVVLLGDAVHTAHFSIGSGTKLAMEDSVALASAFVRRPDSISAALAEYEMERQPVVERFQEAARDSARYFENVSRYAGFHPMQFAFNLLTRSGRISYTNLTLRDPYFMRQLDSWFAANASARADGRSAIGPPPMFAPLRLPGLELQNRVVEAPIGESATDGVPADADRDRLVDAAASGASLVLSGLVAVDPGGRVTPRTPTLHGDPQAEAWADIVAAVHHEGARIALQVGHAGRRGAVRPRDEGVDVPLRRGAWPLLSASPLPYTPGSDTPRAMDADDMAAVRASFVAAAARAAECGLDALLLHLGHGYLLHSFLSPLANRREDEYGGPLANRMRFPLDVFDGVRAAWPEDRLLGVTLSATDWARQGSDVDEAVEVARALAERGCALVHVVAGQTVSEARPEYGRGFLTPFSDRIRSDAGVPTLVGGYVTTADEVNTAVGAGRADLCILDTPQFGLVTGIQPSSTAATATAEAAGVAA